MTAAWIILGLAFSHFLAFHLGRWWEGRAFDRYRAKAARVAKRLA